MNKIIIAISVSLLSTGIAFFFSTMIVCNEFTKACWLDSPQINNSYYVFHPLETDDCMTLQSKLNLFHPNGTNPTKFELIKRMNQLDCQITEEYK